MDQQKRIQKQRADSTAGFQRGNSTTQSNRIFQTHKLAALIPHPVPAPRPLIRRQLVQKLALIQSDSRRIYKLNEAADVIQLAHFTCCY